MKKRFSEEQIIGFLREAEVTLIASGKPFRPSAQAMDLHTAIAQFRYHLHPEFPWSVHAWL